MCVQARKGFREPKLVRTLGGRGVGCLRLLADYFSAAHGAVDGVDDGAVPTCCCCWVQACYRWRRCNRRRLKMMWWPW